MPGRNVGWVCALACTLFMAGAHAAVAGDGDALTVLGAGRGNSEVLALNNKGDAVGSREVQVPGAMDTEVVSYYWSGRDGKRLPLLRGYTATFATAIGDTGLVAGFASKFSPPGAPVPMNLCAFTWNPRTGEISALPVPKGTLRSMAFAITPDESLVSGMLGTPGGVVACVWEKGKDGWTCGELPGSGHSPLLVTSGVGLSSDGRYACGVDGQRPCRWLRLNDGSWKQEVLKCDLFVPKGVNRTGSIAGYKNAGDNSGNYSAVVWTERDGLRDLGVLAGTDSAKGLAINDDGVIVGTAEKHGRDGGPLAVIRDGNGLRELKLPDVIVSTATALNSKGQVAGHTGKSTDEFVRASVWQAGPVAKSRK